MSESTRYTRPGAITASGGALRPHGANLHRRGMRAQQPPVRKIKRVVHGARRMILRNIQRFEIMEVVLDFRSRGHLESRLGKDPLDAQARARHGMHAARLLAAPGQGHIDGALGELLLRAPPARGGCAAFRAPPESTAFASLMRWPAAGRSAADSPPKLLSCSVSSPFLPRDSHAHLVQRGEARRLDDVCERLLDERCERIRHGFRPRGWPWLSPRWP